MIPESLLGDLCMAIPESLRGQLRLPVIGSPLFIVSNPRLVIEQCKAGVVGAFPALNARPAPVLEEWLVQITEELAAFKRQHPEKKVAPFAVNQIVHASNDRLASDVALCEKYRVPIQITSLRAPDEVIQSAHSYGGLVYHDVTNVKHAKRALQAGVDGLILVCAGAGGHAGSLQRLDERGALGRGRMGGELDVQPEAGDVGMGLHGCSSVGRTGL